MFTSTNNNRAKRGFKLIQRRGSIARQIIVVKAKTRTYPARKDISSWGIFFKGFIFQNFYSHRFWSQVILFAGDTFQGIRQE